MDSILKPTTMNSLTPRRLTFGILLN